MGPVAGETETVKGTPFLRYMTGILFPQGLMLGSAADEVAATAEEVGEDASNGEESADDISGGVDLASEQLPSAVGISFKVADNCTVRCLAWGARYERVGEAKSGDQRGEATWRRVPLATKDKPEVVEVRKGTGPTSVFGGRGELTVRWRTRTGGSAIVTIALVNAQPAKARAPDPALALFQVGLRCEVADGVAPYPRVGTNHATGSEEAEVEFLYRTVPSFARGHGAAANWEEPANGRVRSVEADFTPSVDVPGATFKVTDQTIDPRCCDIKFLASAPRDDVVGALDTLAEGYAAWTAKQREAVDRSADAMIAGTLVDRLESWGKRMRAGVERLEHDDVAWRCFVLANEAMGIQMALSKARPKIPYEREERKSMPSLDFSGREWRPFQVAFLLGVVESLIDEASSDRDIVDVIWFPTGGGKTEAYLLVSAFELVRRRMVHGGRDSATAIISRYTLRFLTAQQFQRTGALIVALELLRRRLPRELGDRSFTLGLWVGGAVTPNDYRTAHEKFQGQFESKAPRNPFLLQACPCCGTEIFPTRKSRGRERWVETDFGVVARPDQFWFRCASTACEFREGLPLNVVDEALYNQPPSMLLGTVDKFALLPWDDRSRVFFGGRDDRSVPPSLVLQDELHLISGPLGSLAAPYDAAIDAIIKARGPRAKRIGSTATIRNAREQVRGLYGLDVAVFPSPSTRWDDAYFFSTDRTKPGRTYLGIMGQGYIKPVVAMAWTAAALLQSVKEVPLEAKALDAYWSLLAYHNSRRELGRTLTAAQDEIQARIRAIAASPALARTVREPLELSATMVKSLGEAIEALEKPYAPEDPPVDLVPCTSIISVGVDLDRLGIMLMNGQPKLTSEYIQATSRVGRGEVPGLVVSLFSATKPRDRSHYEDFRAYHESIYRHVEPTSLTPYALPARERTLHAALVSIVRHSTPYRANDAAKTIDFADQGLQKRIADLLAAMRAADPTEADEVEELLRNRLAEWREEAESGFSLLYERLRAGHQFGSLLTPYGKAKAGALWPTMMSVRNVDSEVRVRVLGSGP
jgi:hypothetical protein